MSTAGAPRLSLSEEGALTALLAMLWNPPDAASQTTASAAHGHGQALANRLLSVARRNGHASVPDEIIQVVREAARWAAATDYLPGDDPDNRWDRIVTSITHPLAAGSTERRQIAVPPPADVDAAFTEIEGVIGARPSDDQIIGRAALALWRRLPEAFEPRVLPAHPAYPDSVWSVGNLRAAVAVARGTTGNQRPAVLLMTLASVQAYISQARRTQDLWMGSFLYAYCIWHAMRPIVAELGPWAILTPDLRGQPFVDAWLERVAPGVTTELQRADLTGVASLPNIFTALVPYNEGARLARAATQSLLDARNRLAKAVQAHVDMALQAPRLAGQQLDDIVWQEQIAEFLQHDLFWALAPWDSPDQSVNQLRQLIPVPETWQQWYDAAKAQGSVAPGAGFPLASRLAAVLVEARKHQRDFGPALSDRSGYLCTLCAERLALRPSGPDAGPSALTTFWTRLAAVGRSDTDGGAKLQGRLRAGERLCAVCLTKRLALDAYFDAENERAGKRREAADEAQLGLDRHRFPSTATVATLPFRAQLYGALADQTVLAEAKQWLTSLDRAAPPAERIPASPGLELPAGAPSALARLDGVWFYPDLYSTEAIERELGVSLDEAEKQARKGVLATALSNYRDLLSAVRDWRRQQDRQYTPPARYYAVLALDGDKFGDWLTGKRNPTFEDLLTDPTGVPPELLKLQRPPGLLTPAALASAGRAFALTEAPKAVDDKGGTLIYAGGDDVLALAPREQALALALALEARYRAVATSTGKLLMGPKATISAAIIIAHHSAPLAEVMHTAQSVLKQVAKTRYGRDAFAIHLLKRSGPAATGGGRWRIADAPIAERVDALRQAMQDGRLSRGLLNDMRHALPALGAEPRAGGPGADPELLANRLLVLTERHISPSAPPAVKRDVLTALRGLYQAAQAMLALPEDEFWPAAGDQGRPTPWQLVHDLLRVAEFLAREDEE